MARSARIDEILSRPRFSFEDLMLTSAACRKKAKEKLAQAGRDERHSGELVAAARAWLLLAKGIRQLEPKPAVKR